MADTVRGAPPSIDLRTPPRPARATRHRRPSGAPPPLPHHIQTSGAGWLLAAVIAVVASVAVFGRGLRGPAVRVTIIDNAIVRWFVRLHFPGVNTASRWLNVFTNWRLGDILIWTILLSLAVLRRWRHLLVFLVAFQFAGLVAQSFLFPAARQVRPF